MNATVYRTRPIRVGSVVLGGGAPIAVQTMTKTDPHDVDATVAQIREAQTWGCDLIRMAIPDREAARALRRIRTQVNIPLIADIHFRSELALAALDAGADGLRINPGTLRSPARLPDIARLAEDRKAPIRVGVNAGSMEKDIAARYGGATPHALVESALRYVRQLEDLGCTQIKISVKASDVWRTVEAYRMLAERTQWPLHLGVTEAGPFFTGTVRSSVALAILLSEGVGDTIRVSLTDTPTREVQVGVAILEALGLRPRGASVISCPMCGRTEVDVRAVATQVEEGLALYYRSRPDAPRPVVAVMGCRVNGPGEAREADVALVGGRRAYTLYVNGRPLRAVPESQAVDAVLQTVRQWKDHGGEAPR